MVESQDVKQKEEAMQDAYGILDCYSDGMDAKKKKNYLQAARCFRMCRYYYEQSELSDYYFQVERRAHKSYYWFDYCKSKLTDDAQNMLENEESGFRGHWRDFVRFDEQRIKEEKDTPSPNKLQRRCYMRALDILKVGMQFLKRNKDTYSTDGAVVSCSLSLKGVKTHAHGIERKSEEHP